MALPLLNGAAEDEQEDRAYGFDTTGYAQLPADHLSDPFETNHNSTTPHLQGIQALTHNEGSNRQNGGHVASVYGSYHSGPRGTPSEGLENEGVAGINNVVHIDGLEIRVYGQLEGLRLSSHAHNNFNNRDDEGEIDDVDESERQSSEDAAVQRAKEADDARRSAPLPPDRCQAIMKAMQGVSLGGYQPEWAGKVPEEQWMSRIRRRSMSKTTAS